MLRWWKRLPILYKVLSGNAVVIIIGAIGGTYITQQLVQASVAGLILFFASVGIVLSLLINYFILRTALRSIDVLQQTVERIDRGDTTVRANIDEIDDPQFHHFAKSLNTMLGRLATHTHMIEANRAQLHLLSRQVLSAQEDERKRIARELHDDTSGSLARILLNIEMCSTLVPKQYHEIHDKLDATCTLGEQTLENVRKMVFDLRPALLDDLGLAAAIRWYAKNNLESLGIQLQFEMASGLRGAPMVETALFRIAQEAITNIVRHADAQHVNIQLSHSPTVWKLTIQDDGRGFDLKSMLDESAANYHWGLFGMRERAELLSGTFTIESTIGNGTRLLVEIPVEQMP
ncbi:MAG: sensor histidine kinase [Chloroflexi bacterium]|nr:sensor histidine kinase [Chloroflexota bacterium]